MKTNRTRTIWAVSAVLTLCLLLALARLSGMLNYYRLPSPAMEPNYQKGSLAFSSNLITPSLNDVVVYRDSNLAVPGFRKPALETYMGRMVAQEGDVLEIRDGHTFVNGKRTDEGLRLYFGWILPREDYSRSKNYFKNIPADCLRFEGLNVWVFMEEHQAEQLRREIPAMQRSDPKISALGYVTCWGEAGANWSLNNFGPLTIPPGQVFILGDSRDNSEDCRYRGFIAVKDVVGKVLN